MNIAHMVGDGIQRVVDVPTPSAGKAIQIEYLLCFSLRAEIVVK